MGESWLRWLQGGWTPLFLDDEIRGGSKAAGTAAAPSENSGPLSPQ